MTLFDDTQLKNWLRYDDEDDFDAASAGLAEQVVAGWLTDATGLTKTDLETAAAGDAPQVFSWALELGGIAYENPTSMTDDTTGQTRTAWMDRRSQILAAARGWAGRQPVTGTGTVVPKGCFPAATAWPDPPRIRY